MRGRRAADGRAGTDVRSYARVVAIVAALGLLMFAYRYLDAIAIGSGASWREPFINEMTGVLGGALLLPLVARVIRARPFRTRPLIATAAIHVGTLLAFSVTHTTWNWTTRSILFPLANLGPYDYGSLPWRYAMELSVDTMLYAGCAAVVLMVDRYRAQQDAVVRAARLEEALARAEVQQLQLQLQPHFLFNTLNTIASTMYEDVDAADRMLTELSTLLRRSLETARTPEVPLETELELAATYASLMAARFGDGLTFIQDVEPETRSLLVPAMLLQPLVENAVRHGRLAREGTARIVVRARRHDDGLRIEVHDDGPAAAGKTPTAGTGLGLTAVHRRLELMHGGAASFSAGPSADGYLVALTLPERMAS